METNRFQVFWIFPSLWAKSRWLSRVFGHRWRLCKQTRLLLGTWMRLSQACLPVATQTPSSRLQLQRTRPWETYWQRSGAGSWVQLAFVFYPITVQSSCLSDLWCAKFKMRYGALLEENWTSINRIKRLRRQCIYSKPTFTETMHSAGNTFLFTAFICAISSAAACSEVLCSLLVTFLLPLSSWPFLRLSFADCFPTRSWCWVIFLPMFRI